MYNHNISNIDNESIIIQRMRNKLINMFCYIFAKFDKKNFYYNMSAFVLRLACFISEKLCLLKVS